MNRCPSLRSVSPPRRHLQLLLAVLAVTAFTPWSPFPQAAQAQTAAQGGTQTQLRQFPAAAKRATLEVRAAPVVLINGTAEQLSPGARIHGPNNMLVMSGQLTGQRLQVNYVRDPRGLIHEVWILTAAEEHEKRVGKGPIVNFVFDSDADKPKTDDGKTPFNQLPKYPAQ